MPLRGLLYRKLKESKQAKKPVKDKKEAIKVTTKFESIKTRHHSPMPPSRATSLTNGETIKGGAKYRGGHFLYPIKAVESGEITIDKTSISFVKHGLLKRPEWSFEIPLRKINWKAVSQKTEDEGYYTITCFTIPFRDEKGVIHQPKFSVDPPAMEKFSRFLYKRMTKS